MIKTIRLGTRDSQLALWQTHWVLDRLAAAYPDIELKVISLKTKGDKILDVALSKIGDKGLFTKELDRGMLEGEIDLAVHSLKDVPTINPDGLIIGAITERWNPVDVFIAKNNMTLATLPAGATIATGSLRRRSQLLHYRPDLRTAEIRGNLNTRFQKFDESEDWDGLILAKAGVERLNFQARITEEIPFSIMLPAVGQGSLAIMCRANDAPTREVINILAHAESTTAALAERALLRRLEGGCQIPIGALGRVEGDRLALQACVGSLDGTTLVRDTLTGAVAEAERIGIELAEKLIGQGADKILKSLRE